MRILFFILVLANFAFAAWHAWFSEPDYPTRPIRTAAPTIELFADTEPLNDDSAAAETIAETGPNAAVSRCVSVGPFPNRVDVQDAVDALTAAGFVTQQRTAQGEVWLGYWVYLDAIQTQTAATAIIDQLGAAGIEEAYVIADADSGNIVSLGVFSERARSQQRALEVEALGLTPVTANRSQPGEVFWLDVTAGDGRDFSQTELPAIEVDPELRYATCL